MIPVLLALALTCTPTTMTHERWPVKTRPAPVQELPIRDVTVPDMLELMVPFVTNWRTWPPDQLVTGENSAVRLTGRRRLAKVSKDDCDVHIQIASTGLLAPQVIAEIPYSDQATWQQAVTFFGLTKVGQTKRYAATDAVTIRVTGWLFVDLSHETKDGNPAGHAHGTTDVKTLWEIHPVWKLERVP